MALVANSGFRRNLGTGKSHSFVKLPASGFAGGLLLHLQVLRFKLDTSKTSGMVAML